MIPYCWQKRLSSYCLADWFELLFPVQFWMDRNTSWVAMFVMYPDCKCWLWGIKIFGGDVNNLFTNVSYLTLHVEESKALDTWFLSVFSVFLILGKVSKHAPYTFWIYLTTYFAITLFVTSARLAWFRSAIWVFLVLAFSEMFPPNCFVIFHLFVALDALYRFVLNQRRHPDLLLSLLGYLSLFEVIFPGWHCWYIWIFDDFGGLLLFA